MLTFPHPIEQFEHTPELKRIMERYSLEEWSQDSETTRPSYCFTVIDPALTDLFLYVPDSFKAAPLVAELIPLGFELLDDWVTAACRRREPNLPAASQLDL